MSIFYIVFFNSKKKKSYFFDQKRCINMAASDHLSLILKSLITVANRRLEAKKESLPVTVTSEPRKVSL